MWVGGSVAAVKLPQAMLPAKKITLTLLSASPRPIFRLLFGRHCRLMALLGRKRGGRQWRLVALRALRIQEGGHGDSIGVLILNDLVRS